MEQEVERDVEHYYLRHVLEEGGSKDDDSWAAMRRKTQGVRARIWLGQQGRGPKTHEEEDVAQ